MLAPQISPYMYGQRKKVAFTPAHAPNPCRCSACLWQSIMRMDIYEKKTDDYTEKMAGCRPYPFYCCLVWYDCLFHASDDRRNTDKRSSHTTYHLCSGG